MSRSSKQASAELLEDRESWIRVFNMCYNCDCTMKQVEDLDKGFVFSIYLQFAKFTLRASLDKMKQMGPMCPEDCHTYPEAYEKAILAPRLAKLLAWFFNKRYKDNTFGFEDLFAVDKSRTRRFFNYMVNAIHELSEFDEATEKIRLEAFQRKEDMARIESEHSRLLASLQQLKEQQKEMHKMQEQGNELNEKLMQSLQNKGVVKEQLKAELEAKKKEIAEQAETARALTGECDHLAETIQELEGCVVTQAELDDLQQRDHNIATANTDNSNKDKQLEALESLHSETERKVALLKDKILPLDQDLSHQLQELAELLKTEDLCNRQSRAQSASEELDHRNSVLREKLAALDEQRSSNAENWNRKMNGFQADMQAARQMLDELDQADKCDEAKEVALKEQLQAADRELDALQKEAVQVEEFFKSRIAQHIEALKDYNSWKKQAFNEFIMKLNEHVLDD
ncbi:immunoglobulin G-binding protein H-like [Hyalella azteca]|uniref:Immunoglobulin G-binding protein H-like n=1 Tax=Hyalella azteca TaxID=294128 RepID=A0A8B7NE17_HYAAZ|nr:immunoglobulin G-binding protein H-like [Hyalella azteca]XP_018011852.1 immunoglobulin G-binding protein H-like [Hyalella azteca]